jgi:hypothetical protein
MTDICKCTNEECKLKEQCERQTPSSYPYYQAYCNFKPEENGKCVWFIKIKEYER